MAQLKKVPNSNEAKEPSYSGVLNPVSVGLFEIISMGGHFLSPPALIGLSTYLFSKPFYTALLLMCHTILSIRKYIHKVKKQSHAGNNKSSIWDAKTKAP